MFILFEPRCNDCWMNTETISILLVGKNLFFISYGNPKWIYLKLAVISEGNQVPGEQEFDLCFGGRRQFCKTEYADLGIEIIAIFFKPECHYSFSGSFHMDKMQWAIDSRLTLSRAGH